MYVLKLHSGWRRFYLGLCRILTKVADALFSSSWRMLVVQFRPFESDVCAQARRPVHFAT